MTIEEFKKESTFKIGDKNTAFSKYFIGQSYLYPYGGVNGVNVANVTFEPGCRNNWHIHHKGGQILICIKGEGYYQEWGHEVRKLHEGDIVFIKAEVKHWHGATKDSYFSHLAIEVPAEGSTNERLEEVNDNEYSKLN